MISLVHPPTSTTHSTTSRAFEPCLTCSAVKRRVHDWCESRGSCRWLRSCGCAWTGTTVIYVHLCHSEKPGPTEARCLPHHGLQHHVPFQWCRWCQHRLTCPCHAVRVQSTCSAVTSCGGGGCDMVPFCVACQHLMVAGKHAHARLTPTHTHTHTPPQQPTHNTHSCALLHCSDDGQISGGWREAL